MRKRKQQAVTGKTCVVLAIIIFALLLPACGAAPGDVPQAEEDFVYFPRHLATSASGSYALPEGFGRPQAVGDTLYFLQETVTVQTVRSAEVREEEGEVDLEGAQVEVALSPEGVEMEAGRGWIPDEEGILAMLDQAMERGKATVLLGEAQATLEMNPARTCLYFSLADYGVDQEGSLYLALSCSRGNFVNREHVGSLFCRRSPEGEWAYRSFFPEVEIQAGCLAVDGAGGLYVLTEEGILGVDSQGREAGLASTSAYKDGNTRSESILGDPEGRARYFVQGEHWMSWKGVALEKQGNVLFRKEDTVSGEDWLDNVAMYQGNLLYTYSQDGILRESSGDGSSREILRWQDSDLISRNIRAAMVLDPDRILVWQEDQGEQGLFLLSRMPAGEVPRKKTVVLAALGLPDSMADAVTRFNRQGGEYQVVVEDYGYSSGGAEGALVRLDAALVSGDPPELLLLAGRNLEGDMGKGLLEDLSPYLEASDVLGREDFLDNVLAGYTVSGKLAGIPRQMTMKALAGRLSQLGSLSGGCTMEDVYALMEAYPGMCLLGDGTDYELNTREYLLGSFCAAYYLETFVDWEKGECRFDSEEFRRLLLWVGEHGKETVRASGIRFHEVGPMQEDALLMENWLDFWEVFKWKAQFGEEISLLGYPTADGRVYAHIRVETPLGIVAGSQNKEGAWEFLEYYLTEETEEMGNTLSTRKEVLQRQMEEAMGKENPVGEHSSSRGIVLDGKTYFYEAISPEMAGMVMAFLEEADFTPASSLRDRVASIVTEEAELYYGGSKSLDEVVEVIQNRVQLMLEENR